MFCHMKLCPEVILFTIMFILKRSIWNNRYTLMKPCIFNDMFAKTNDDLIENQFSKIISLVIDNVSSSS